MTGGGDGGEFVAAALMSDVDVVDEDDGVGGCVLDGRETSKDGYRMRE